MEEKDKNLVQETSENATLNEQMEEEREFLSDKAKIMSPGRLVAKRFFRSRLSVVGLVILIALYVLSFVGPWFTGYHYSEIDQNPGNIKYSFNYVSDGDYYLILEDIPTQNINDPPSSRHWLGTDGKGRDVLTRTFWGGRISMTLGFVVILLEGLIGIVLGGIAGYFGKWVDQLIMRIVDIFMCVPTFPIMLIAGTLLDAYEINGMSRIYWLMLVLTIFGWSGIARLVRGQILMLREQEYMIAAEATGLSTSRKIFKHLIPNVMPQLIVSMTMGLGGIIISEATLSYLGLGVQEPYASWGTMINAIKDMESEVYQIAYQWIPPGICIILAVLGFNFVGDGLRDAFDPKMKR